MFILDWFICNNILVYKGVSVMNELLKKDYESLHIFYNHELEVHVLIAFDNSVLGPGLGGCRYIKYNNLEDAIAGVKKLAAAMTLKTSASGLNYGGGKTVIYDPKIDTSDETRKKEILHFLAQSVNELGGRYIASGDSGVSAKDLALVACKTKFISGYYGQSTPDVYPAFFAARGVILSFEKAYEIMGIDIAGSRAVIKGVGGIGEIALDYLVKHGATVDIIETHTDRAKHFVDKYNVKLITKDDMMQNDYDLLCPCDVEPTVTWDNIDKLRVKIICGGTNNQLEHDDLGQKLADLGIIYCPDFVVNAGGVIAIAMLYDNDNTSGPEIEDRLGYLPGLIQDIVEEAYKNKQSTVPIAYEKARSRIREHQE